MVSPLPEPDEESLPLYHFEETDKESDEFPFSPDESSDLKPRHKRKKMVNGRGMRRYCRRKISGQASTEGPRVGAEMLEKLPVDMLVVILCCVASTSGEAYRCCQQTCKTLYDLSKEKIVLQSIRFTEKLLCHGEWKFAGPQFLQILAENENPLALFQIGIKQFCTLGMEDEGLKKLEKASLLGYATAKYALGVIKLGGSEAPEGRDEGMRMIAELKSELGLNISKCRRGLFNRVSSRYQKRDWDVTAQHRYYPLPYTKHDHSKTCMWMCGWTENAGTCLGVVHIGGPPINHGEIAHLAQCHACEWILESKVFCELQE